MIQPQLKSLTFDDAQMMEDELSAPAIQLPLQMIYADVLLRLDSG